jgi:hypothetical protein
MNQRNLLIEELELGLRAYNCLKRAGVSTVGDLVSLSPEELERLPGFGQASMDEVVLVLEIRGLYLRPSARVRIQIDELTRAADRHLAALVACSVGIEGDIDVDPETGVPPYWDRVWASAGRLSIALEALDGRPREVF